MDAIKNHYEKNSNTIKIIGAIAALITALTPLYVEWFSDTGAKAQLAAKKSDQKAEIGYELLSQKIILIEEQISLLNDGLRANQEFLKDVLLESLDKSKGVSPKKGRSEKRGPVDDVANIKRMLEQMDGQIADTSMGQDVIEMEQKQLPKTLEEQIRKSAF